MPTVPEPLLTVKEVASVYRVEPRTIQRWAKAGRIKAVPTPGGRLRRFRTADVEALLADEPELAAQNENGPALATATPDEPLVHHP